MRIFRFVYSALVSPLLTILHNFIQTLSKFEWIQSGIRRRITARLGPSMITESVCPQRLLLAPDREPLGTNRQPGANIGHAQGPCGISNGPNDFERHAEPTPRRSKLICTALLLRFTQLASLPEAREASYFPGNMLL